MGYIRVPVETNPENLSQDAFTYIQTQKPTWRPNDGNLDTWIIRAFAAKAAENRTLASDVPDDIFATLGASLFAIPPIDDVAATGNTTWTLTDTLGHTIPDGTNIGIRNANGDLVNFVTVGDVVVAPGSNTTTAGQVLIMAVEAGTDANTLTGNVELVDVLDWVSSIATTAPTGGGVDAETFDEYLDRLTRKLTALSTVPILISNFGNAALDADPGVFRAVAIDGYNPQHNLLTANEASIETDATGYTAGSNTTIARSTAQAADGSASLSLTSTAAGNVSAAGLIAGKPAIPGELFTAVASVRSAASVRSCRVDLEFLDGSNVQTGYVGGTPVNSSTTGFVQLTATGTAPANTVKVRIWVIALSTAAGAEVHYFDKMQIRRGSYNATTWVAGGTAETNNTRTVTIVAVDAAGNDVSSGIKTNITNYINSRREANWITYVMSPKYSQIDVATTVRVLPGYSSTSVNADVVTALTNYLNPANWAQDPNASSSDAPSTWVDMQKVYYNELIALVSNVPGVDRVIDLTSNIHTYTIPARVDITLPGPASLTAAGTITSVAA